MPLQHRHKKGGFPAKPPTKRATHTKNKEHTPKRERRGSNRTPPRLPPPTPPSLVGSVGSASLQRRCQAPPGESCGAQRSWGGSSGNLPDRSPGGLKPKDGKPKGKPTQLERKVGSKTKRNTQRVLKKDTPWCETPGLDWGMERQPPNLQTNPSHHLKGN